MCITPAGFIELLTRIATISYTYYTAADETINATSKSTSKSILEHTNNTTNIDIELLNGYGTASARKPSYIRNSVIYLLRRMNDSNGRAKVMGSHRSGYLLRPFSVHISKERLANTMASTVAGSSKKDIE